MVLGTLVENEIGPAALIDMAEGQKAEGTVLRTHLKMGIHGVDLVKEAPVAEHHALGVARRAGGIDDTGQMPGRVGGRPCGARGIIVGCGRGRQQVAEGLGAVPIISGGVRCVEADDMVQQPVAVGKGGDFGILGPIAHKKDLYAGVAHDIFGLAGRIGGINRHGNGVHRQDAEIGDGPLHAVLGKNAHPVPGPDVHGGEGGCDAPDPPAEFSIGDGLPGIIRFIAHGHPVGIAAAALGDHICEMALFHSPCPLSVKASVKRACLADKAISQAGRQSNINLSEYYTVWQAVR